MPLTQVIELSISENVHRKNPKPFELFTQFMAFKEASGLETWDEVRRHFHLKPATFSRIISDRYIPADCRELAEQVCPTIRAAIASRKNPEIIKQGLEFAARANKDGKHSSLRAVESYLATLKVERPRSSARRKPLKGAVKGRTVQIAVLPGDSTDTIIQGLKDLTTQLSNHSKIPPESLGFLFK